MQRGWLTGFAGCALFSALSVRAEQSDDGVASPAPTSIAAPNPADPSASATAFSVAPESLISKDYLKLIWADAKETATEPLRWDGDNWRNFGLITGGLVVIGAYAD